MATNHWWLGTTNTDHAVAANWSTAGSGGAPGASVPGAGDEVQFDGNGNNACTLTANWALLHLTTLAGYTVKLDLATFDLTMDDSGNIILDQGGEFDCGTGTISLTNGDFDNLHVTTFTKGTSTLLMSGAGNLVSDVLNDLNDLTISAAAVITATETYQILGSLIVNGSLSIASGKIAFAGSGGTISIGAAGRITGNGTFRVYVPGAGEGITAFTVGGVIDVSTLEIFRPNAAAVIAPGTYQSTLVKIYNNVATTETLTLSNGNYIFTGNIEFKNTNAGGSLTVANNTYNPTIELQGDFLVDEQAGTITWTKGNGTITATGANAQDWDLLGRTVEDIVVNKTNKIDVLTFSGPLTTDSLLVTKGTIDPNGQTITIVGNMTMTTNGQFDPAADAMDGCEFAIGGDLDFDGSNGDPLIMKWQAAFTLDVANDCNLNWVTFTPSDSGGGKVDMLLEVSNNAVATNCVAEHSDAGGYTTVQATTSTNSGNNTNWTFLYSKSATSTLEFTTTNDYPKTMTESEASSLEFTQTEVYTAEYLREESGTLTLAGVDVYGFEATRSEASLLELTYSIDVTLTPAPTLCELRQHWPRWIFASTSKYFKDIADDNNLHFFIEGTHRFTQENQEYLEFRMDGPSVREVSKNYFLIDVEINILWSFNQDNSSFHRPAEITGILMEAMDDICVYRYGDDFVDNDKLLGTLTLRQDKKTPIRVNNFGQIRTDVKMMQGTVEGTFRMTLTCTGR